MKKYDASFVYKAVGTIIAVAGMLGCLAALIGGLRYPIVISIVVFSALISFIVIGIGIALQYLEDIRDTVWETEETQQKDVDPENTQYLDASDANAQSKDNTSE